MLPSFWKCLLIWFVRWSSLATYRSDDVHNALSAASLENTKRSLILLDI